MSNFLKALSSESSWLQAPRKIITQFYRHHLKAILQKINGYHFGVLCCAWASGIVLVLNLVVTIWVASALGTEAGIGTLQDGSCKRSSTLGFWIHMIINALSTTLLGASNYIMQCLNSPTRDEIDKAHGRGSWLDVGLPSFRNLRKIGQSRQIQWWLLAVSTIPLHLLWNSAVFASLPSHDYTAYIVPDEFPKKPTFNYTTYLTTMFSRLAEGDQYVNEVLANVSHLTSTNHTNGYHGPAQDGSPLGLPYFKLSKIYQSNEALFEKLDAHTCAKRYAGPITADRGDVILISTHNYNDPQNAGNDAVNNTLSLTDYNMFHELNASLFTRHLFRSHGEAARTNGCATVLQPNRIVISREPPRNLKVLFSRNGI
ncbi:hypothetical protein ACLMJK_009507 [Lecanora helva]